MSLFCCPSCGLPAEDIRHFVVESTDGPIEYYHACCVQMHRFTIPASTVAESIEVEATVPEPALETELVLDLRDGLLSPATSPGNAEDAAAAQPATTGSPESAEATSDLAHLPPPHTTVDTLWAPRSRLAAGAFFAGGLSSGFLLKVPVVLAFAIVLGLMAVAVVATLVPMALASRRIGRGQIASFGHSATGSASSSSNDEGQRAA
jgi:hypothetical protein